MERESVELTKISRNLHLNPYNNRSVSNERRALAKRRAYSTPKKHQ